MLADSGSDVIVITEHWLWPFETYKLDAVHADFASLSVCDGRLTDTCDLSSGCGGVGMLYKKSLTVTEVRGINSDRICGLSIHLPDKILTVLGVYLPCASQKFESYREHLMELERIVSECQQVGQVLIAGDFNAHLGTLGGPRGEGEPNLHGLLVKELVDRCSLYVISQSERSEGPSYTFWSSNHQTTVDYNIIGDADIASDVTRCFTHSVAPLNTSDHLPVSAVLRVAKAPMSCYRTMSHPQVNWSKVQDSASLEEYQRRVSAVVTPLLGKIYEDVSELNDEIVQVSKHIVHASLDCLPLRKETKKKTNWVKDEDLAHLAHEKKKAWDVCKAEGRPIHGPLFDRKTRTRMEFRQRLSFCKGAAMRRNLQHFDKKFRERNPSRFKFPRKKNKHAGIDTPG